MSFRPNVRRVFTSWASAIEMADTWGWQTGRKYRVHQARPGYWRVTRTSRPVRITMTGYQEATTSRG